MYEVKNEKKKGTVILKSTKGEQRHIRSGKTETFSKAEWPLFKDSYEGLKRLLSMRIRKEGERKAEVKPEKPVEAPEEKVVEEKVEVPMPDDVVEEQPVKKQKTGKKKTKKKSTKRATRKARK